MASSAPPPAPPPGPPPSAQCSGGAASTSGQANVQSAAQFWEQMVNHWYPKLEQEPCFLPHVHFNKLNYKTVQVGGKDVFVSEPPVLDRQQGDTRLSISDARDDKTSQRLMYCLRQFATQQKIPMFVLQELEFSDYLADPKFCTVTQQLPRPCDLKPTQKKKNKKKKKKSAGPSAAQREPIHVGDFDLLIVHPDYGLLVGEVKTVGDTFTGSAADQQNEDNTVVKRVKKAIKQLNKERTVLTHMVSDFQPAPRVRATLILPNISRSQLQRVLNDNPPVQQDLSQCLDVTGRANPLDLCLCADNLSDKATFSNVTDDIINSMLSWWSHTMTSRGPDTASGIHFRSIVARFAGPATTVRIACVSEPRLHLHTVGEAVSETGRRFADIVLHPDQLAILTSNEPRVFLLSGPGCGKSLLLVLKAVMWLQEGHHVCVVSTRGTFSEAACQMVHHQIQQMTDPAAHQRLSLHLTSNTSTPKDVIKNLMTKVDSQGRLFLIFDEAIGQVTLYDMLSKWYSTLEEKAKEIHMWCAASDVAAGSMFMPMTTHNLTVPLRSPPVLVRHIAQSDEFSKRMCPAYTESDAPLTSDGPPVHEIIHVDGERGHPKRDTDFDLGKCEQCGLDTASFLVGHLHVGQTGSTTASRPDSLKYRDVMVLPFNAEFCDEETDEVGNVKRHASPFVRGLRRAGLPVRVVKEDDATAMYEMAVNGGPDQVTVVVNEATVNGLERKVVVLVDAGSNRVGADQRFDLVSRCTSQLIWIQYAKF